MMQDEPWIDATSGSRMSHPEAMARLATARVVCLGERHDRAEDHHWQLQVIAGLAALRSDIVVGFEMFPRSSQAGLDAWCAGLLTPEAFLNEARWAEVWGFDPELYWPLMHLCRDLRLPMRALNVDRVRVSEIGRGGWETMSADERRWLSPALPATPAYRRYLFAVTGGARPGRAATSPEDPAFDRFVRAQQVWDRAFACAMAETLASDRAVSIVGLIGRGHLEYRHGTPAQLADLGIADVMVALPLEEGAAFAVQAPPIADLLFLAACTA